MESLKLSKYSYHWFDDQLNWSPDILYDFFGQLHEPRFSIGQIGINSQELQNWKKYNIIELPQESERIWSKLSFFEFCWLRLVKTMREKYVPFNVILNVKKELFTINQEAIIDQLKTAINNLSKKHPGSGHIANASKELDTLPPVFIKEQFSQHFNYFILLIISLVFHDNKAFLILHNNDEISLIGGEPGKEELFLESLVPFLDQSFIAINLNRLLDEFYDNPKIKSADYKSIFLLREKEKRVFDLLRKDGVKELKVKFDLNGKGMILVEVKEQKSVIEMNDKIHKILSGEKYKDIRIVTENNKIVLCEVVTKTKL